MPIMSAGEIRKKLNDACCKCKQVREKVETQRVLQDAVDASPQRPATDVGASASFHARPNPR